MGVTFMGNIVVFESPGAARWISIRVPPFTIPGNYNYNYVISPLKGTASTVFDMLAPVYASAGPSNLNGAQLPAAAPDAQITTAWIAILDDSHSGQPDPGGEWFQFQYSVTGTQNNASGTLVNEEWDWNVYIDPSPTQIKSFLPSSIVGVFASVTRADAAFSGNVALAGQIVGNLSQQLETTNQAAIDIVHSVAGTSSVATLAYEFFTGSAPSAGGMDYLVSPTGPNPNNLNSAYYQSFGLENRYINFASNLGRAGAGSAQFTAQYGNLTPEQAMTKAYQTIFGGTPSADKVSHLLHDLVPNGVGGSYERLAYFQSYGGDGPSGIGTKAAMVGWLLAEAVKADLGTYALSNDAFLTDVALHNAPYGVDIIGHYAQAGFVYQPG